MPLFPTSRTGAPTRVRPRVVDRRQLETVEEHEAAQAAIEFATMKRQADELLSAALRQASEAPDDATSDALFSSAEQTISKIASRNPRVQNAFTAHIEGSLAGWQERFARQRQAINRQNLLDQSEQNYEAALERGDLEESGKALLMQTKVFPERGALNEKRFADIPTTSALLRMRRALAERNADAVTAAADTLDESTMTVEQLEERNKILRLSERDVQEGQEAWLSDLAGKAIAARNLPTGERHAAIGDLRAALIESAHLFPASSVREMSGFLDRMEAQEAIISDPVIKSDLLDESLQLRDDTPETVAADLRRRLDEHLVKGDISNEDYETLRTSLTKRSERPDKAMADMVDQVVDSARETYQITDLADFKWELTKAIKKSGWTPEEAWKMGHEIASAWVDKPKRLFTAKEITEAMGKVRAQRETATREIENATEAIRFLERTFGEDWQTIAPGAVELIGDIYPDAAKAFEAAGVPHVKWADLDVGSQQRDMMDLRDQFPQTWGWWTSGERSIKTSSGNVWDEYDVKAANRIMAGKLAPTEADIEAFKAYLKDRPPRIWERPMPMPTTKAEVEALPVGTHYIWTDGTERIRS